MENKLELQTTCYQITRTGLNVVRQSTEQEWEQYGEMLGVVGEATQWAVGDWLADGKTHKGDGLYKRAAEILGVDEGTLRKQKSLSSKFDLFLRRNNLSWNHHSIVSSIKKIGSDKDGKLALSKDTDHDAISRLLQQAEKEELSTRKLSEVVSQYKRRQQEEIRLANEPERFSVILADPAWEYDFSKSDSRQIENQYLPSTMEDMKRLRVPASEDSIIFMWATSPKLREALELMQAWGFEYKTCMVWVKDKIGMGYYARQKHELLLIGGKGRLELADPSIRPESVFFAPRNEHSAKPQEVYQIIETMYPTYNKLEMFAREEREGWESWGDQT